jgi:hypothetical protein
MTVNHGAATALTAAPGTGYNFVNWTVTTGTATIANATSATAATVTLSAGNATVTANFALKTYQLTVAAGTGGTVSPASATVNHGVATSITASPSIGYVFTGWTVTAGTATIAGAGSASTMVTLSSGAATVTAAFRSITFEKVTALADQFRGVKQLTDGGYIITGNKNMVRLDVNGVQVFSKAYDDNGYGGSGFSANSINVLSDGGYIVAGSAYNFSDDDMYLMRFYANGNRQWYKHYGGTYGESGTFAIQTSEGGFLTGGTSSSFGTNNNDFYIVKTSATGDTSWTRVYDGGGVERLNDAIAVSDGYILVGGANMGSNIWVVKVSSTGTTLWDNNYTAASGSSCCGAMLYSVRQCSGGYIISGSTSDGASLLLKINSSGTLLWSKNYSNCSSISAVRETSDGGFVFVSSTTAIGNSGSNVYLAKTNSAGTLSWERGLGGNLDEFGFSVEQTQDGGYVVVGSSDNKGYIVKTDANGQVTP